MQVELIMEKMPNLLTQQIRDMTNLDCYQHMLNLLLVNAG
jgi:hypothetical protein